MSQYIHKVELMEINRNTYLEKTNSVFQDIREHSTSIKGHICLNTNNFM